MLFRAVDLSDLKRASGAQSERMGRINSGLTAVKAAMAGFMDAQVPLPADPPRLSPADVAQFTESDGPKYAARLTEAVAQVIAVRNEIAACEQAVLRGKADVDAATKARNAGLVGCFKTTLKLGAAVVVFLWIKSCIS